MGALDPDLELIARGDVPAEHADLIGASVAPDGRFAVVMLAVGEGQAAEFDETVAERVGDRWVALQSGTPSSVIYAGDWRAAPLCNYVTPLPPEVEQVVVADRGDEHEVLVKSGYFLYVAWKRDEPGDDRSDPPTPELLRTIPPTPLG
ncbi:MAG TPA: hypothetical protein VJ716_00500 [Gaiellaceae bacterium]|nr:hypothetical protein [Gaiellaceae bacterium]